VGRGSKVHAAVDESAIPIHGSQILTALIAGSFQICGHRTRILIEGVICLDKPVSYGKWGRKGTL
jgi:hypothetical protein